MKSFVFLGLGLLSFAQLGVTASTPSFSWMNISDPPGVRAAKLMNEMTLEEKLFYFHGSNTGYTGGVQANKRLNIPALKYNDGPQGFRDNNHLGSTTSFPSSLTIGATFDPTASLLWGETMGQEFFDKGANVQLGPGFCLARVPRNGRNFEYISGEDPFLGYVMAGPAITGIQSKGVIANAKHWVNNNQETNRQSSTKSDSADVDERTEFEMYYPPFKGAIDAGVGSIMCSYNEINDRWSCENPQTLQRDLKDTLGFKGWVMSDWGATHSPSMNAGLDQEMPGSRYMGDALAALVKSGEVTMKKVNDSILRILTPMFQMKLFDVLNNNTIDNNVTSAEHNHIARELATRATVLLQNKDHLLPLKANSPLKIAVIGKQGLEPIVHGGGSGQVIPYYVSKPIDALRVRLGLAPMPGPPAPGPNNCSDKHYDVGFDYRNTDGQTSAHAKTVDECCQLCAKRRTDKACNYFTFVQSDNTCWMKNTNHNRIADAAAISGGCHSQPSPPPPPPPNCNQAGDRCVYYSDGSDHTEAAKLAASVDVAIVFAKTFSSEGGDRASLRLDDNVDALIAAVAAAAPRKTVVAMVQPGAVLTPWRADVSAIVASFMPGQEYGNALADVLFGDVGPSARLPVTFPARENQVNFTTNQWPGVNKESTYSEKLEVGYRYYDAHDETPAFPFGHGLSYSEFTYSDLQATQTTVSFTLRNTGKVKASEVPQLYLGFPPSAGEPPKQLKGFKQVPLAVGASAKVTFQLTARDISIWDVSSHNWAVQKGMFQVMVGSSSRDIRLSGHFTAQL